MSCRLLSVICVSTLLLLTTVRLTHAAEPRPVGYNRDIRPLLSDKCFHCHGPDEAERQAGLRLDQAEGDEGAYRESAGTLAIDPGSVESSELWQRIIAEDPDVVMPPPDSHKKPFTPEERELIRRWIEQGAKYESFWAFIPPTYPQIPKLAAPSNSPIDQFVFRRLEEEGLSPATIADRRTLIRRVTFDLTGLPPTREEIEVFLADESTDAYENLVDRLLDSPHYGEHMAKYWLDVVRFADTNGIHHDHYRDLSPYRDWVIRSFNDNLPYDDFVRYQIAGDLFENPKQDQLIASGFHRLHLIIDRGTMLPEESFSRNVIDRVSSVGTAFLGLTLQCAVCHDHKYDPITAKDFYSLAGFFNNIDAEPETGSRSGTDFLRGLQEPYIDLPSEEQSKQLQALEADLARLKAKLAEQKEESTEQELATVQKKYDALLLTIPAAMVMKERTEVRPSQILIRGAYDKPGETVQRATPAFLTSREQQADASDKLLTRIDLAEWLVAPQNPLTARVTVNRFWQQLFGVGIVRTAEDFGAQGEWPSHPDLLDYLAVRFVESGWDVKALMKEMVMSHTYQQSAHATQEAFQQDPQNRLLARGSRFRMDAEMIRDQILASSGLLNRELFGKSVKPPQPEGLWEGVSMPSSYPKDYAVDSGDKIYRRSLYTFWKRAMPPPQMTILNAPSREECVARRERTNTPLQALLLLNEAEYLKAARYLAAQTLAEVGDDRQRLEVIYETITSQPLTPQIQQSLLTLASDLRAMYAQSPELAEELCAGAAPTQEIALEELAAWTMVASAVYNLDISKTRQ